MTVLTGCFVAVLGLVIGSFLNVCICRAETGESIAHGRSHCMSCGHALAAPDLVPLFSYLFLRGRCRYCKARISSQYPAVEALNAALWLLVWQEMGIGVSFVLSAVFCSALVVAGGVDLRTRIIPNSVVLILAAVGVAEFFVPGGFSPLDRLLGAAAGGVPLFLAAIFSHGGMGGGDIKLAAACGLFLGWQDTLLALFFGCVTAAVWGLCSVARHKNKMHSAIAFGPFLAGGFAVALIWGGRVLAWYLHLGA